MSLQKENPYEIEEFVGEHEAYENEMLESVYSILVHTNGSVTRDELLKMGHQERNILIKALQKKMKAESGGAGGASGTGPSGQRTQNYELRADPDGNPSYVPID